MYYYEVALAERSYQGRKLLTYSSPTPLELGQIIVVKVRTLRIHGFIVNKVSKPSFSVTPIEEILNNVAINHEQIQLFKWIYDYYPAGLGSTASLFTPPTYAKSRPTRLENDVSKTTANSKLPVLSEQQKSAFNNILQSKAQTHILHGDTGTGKTRVYLELVKTILAQNKSAIVLTPEISLTPQLFEQFNSEFERVSLVHSGLTVADRRDIWLKVASENKPQVIIGPRSALFYPVKDIGLIVIDEFHDSAYKQDQSPRYNGLRVAGKISQIHNAKLVMGSATPPIEDYFYAVSKGAQVHRLTEKPLKYDSQKNLHIVDLGDHSQNSKYPLLSKALIELITRKLEKNQQIMLFLNKRGTSRLVICQSCGWHADCERCNIPYTYHHDKHELVCHICGDRRNSPNNCPLCASSEILFKNPGTKAIEESLTKLFPKAKIGRYDKDNKKNETFSANQSSISQGKVDILIGTQLLVKGHDLPKLSLVGILMAEGGLQFPDYNSEEKSFQLLHQIAGRVGRGHTESDIVLQTYSPNSKTISYINHAEDDWTHFYANELQQRKKYNFPPFCYLLKINVSRKTEQSSENFAESIAQKIRANFASDIQLLGPAPAFFYKQNAMYNWQIILKSPSRSTLISVIETLPKSCTYDIDPNSLL